MKRVDRRTFLRHAAVVSAATAASAAVPAVVSSSTLSHPRDGPAGPIWKKTPCRLCGVGCGLLVGVENGRAVAVKGDPDSPVSKGSACVKGYNSVQALYGRDRITRAMVRRNGLLVEVPLARGARPGGAQAPRDRPAARQGQRRHLRIRPVDDPGRLRRVEAVQGRAGNEQRRNQRAPLRGQRDGRPREQLRPRWRDRLLRGHRPRRRLRAVGHQSRRNRPGALLPDAGPQAGQPGRPHHRPVHPHHAHELRRRPHPAARAPCWARDRQRDLPGDRGSRSWVHREFVDRHVAFKRGKTDIGYGLADDVLVADEATDVTWDDTWHSWPTTPRSGPRSCPALPAASIRWLASLYGDPPRKVMSVWGREREPGRARHLDEQPALQHPPAGRERSRRPGTAPSAPPDSPAVGAPCTTRAP